MSIYFNYQNTTIFKNIYYILYKLLCKVANKNKKENEMRERENGAL